METNLSNAVLLLGIGMITVFVVLGLVVLSGQVLIKFINKYVPAPKMVSKPFKPGIPNKKIAVLTAVVDHVTGGRGKIESIKRVD